MEYSKTKWIDGSTPLNATNMNKIESAIKELADTALTPSCLKGDGTTIETSVSDGVMTIKATNRNVMISSSVSGIISLTTSQFSLLEQPEEDVMYFIYDEVSKLKYIMFHNVFIYNADTLKKEAVDAAIEEIMKNYCVDYDGNIIKKTEE